MSSLAPFEQRVVELLPQAPVNHVDESGLRVAKTLHWLHVVSNPALTFYGVHPKRGREAMDHFDILPRCTHWLIHDHWKPYFTYDQCLHALCNEHHLRELKFLHEEHQEDWAQAMSTLLLDRLAYRKDHGVLDQAQFRKLQVQYHAILSQGRRRHPQRDDRGPQSKAANLLTRLEDFDLNVPGLHDLRGSALYQQRRRARHPHGEDPAESLGLLSHPARGQGLCPHSQLHLHLPQTGPEHPGRPAKGHRRRPLHFVSAHGGSVRPKQLR